MRYLSVLFLAATASAQTDIQTLSAGMSPECQVGAGSLITSDFSTCANLMSLLNVLGAKVSLLPTLSSWVDGLCSLAPCSPSAVADASTSIQQTCGADVKKGVPAAVDLSGLVSSFPSIRTSLCLQYQSNQTRCASNILSAAEKAAGRPLTLQEIIGFAAQGFGSLLPAVSSHAKDVLCNDCGQALYTVFSANPPTISAAQTAASASGQTASNNVTAVVTNTCGASFISGKMPSSVVSPAAQNSTSNGNQGNPAAIKAPSSANSLATPVSTFAAGLVLATLL